MKPESLENLKYDRRLDRRRGWVSDEERLANIDSLPDVADKVSGDNDDEVTASADPAPEATDSSSHSAPESTPANTAFDPVASPEVKPPFDEV
jgi:hypothetical protein